MEHLIAATLHRAPWNKGKLVGQKAPFKLKEIWAIRVRLQFYGRIRDLALFNLAIDSKLRACDLVRLRVRDVCHGDRVDAQAIIMQRKIQRPVQFEITEQTRQAVTDWIRRAGLRPDEYLFPSRVRESPHLSTRQYARIADCWVREIGLDPAAYGTHTLRRTKASLIFSPSARIAAHGRSRPPRDEAVGTASQGRSGRMMAMLDGDILTLLDAVTTQQRSASPTLTRGPVGAALYRPEARKRRQTSYHRPPREVRRCFALSS